MILETIYSTGPPDQDLALESWLLERAAAGGVCAAMCSWPRPTVVLGYAQPATDVDLEWCCDRGIPVLRRLTGGTGVVHHNDLGVSLALPADHPWARGIVSLYGRFLDVLKPALNAAGARVQRLSDPGRARPERSPICFEDQLADTLVVDGRKAVGCAQTRKARSALIHAAVLLGLDAELVARVFQVEAERVRRSLTAAVPGGDWRVVADVVTRHLGAALGLEPTILPRPELPAEMVERHREPRWAPVSPSVQGQGSRQRG
jgi:lipoate-protein ligase A